MRQDDKKCPLAPMGFLAHGSAHARPSTRTLAEIFRDKCLQSNLQHLPQPLRSHIQSFGTLGQLLKIPPLTPQIYDSAGSRWGSLNSFLVGILQFLLVRSPCKISEPYGKNFRSRRWGSSLPVCARLMCPLVLPSTEVEIFRHTCLQSHL
jgi:hypothetical protein